MRQKHENQLYYYSLAVERMFGKMPDRVEVYSLHLGDTVSVKKRPTDISDTYLFDTVKTQK
jgi:hypothetical protein